MEEDIYVNNENAVQNLVVFLDFIVLDFCFAIYYIFVSINLFLFFLNFLNQ